MTMNVDNTEHLRDNDNQFPQTRFALLSHSREQPGESTASDSASVNGEVLDKSRVDACRWCRRCGRQVTGRRVLSTSAGSLSFSKFLEILLHDSSTTCSPLAAGGELVCTHCVFRNHVHFFGSRQRPVVVGFKWEQVQLWRLQPPHIPFWDTGTGALTTSCAPDMEQPDRTFETRCVDLIRRLGDLVDVMDGVVDSALAALAAQPQQNDLSGRQDEDDRGRSVDAPWLAWLHESWITWVQVVKKIVGFQGMLRGRLQAAAGLLAAGGPQEPDLVLIAYVERDLWDALCSTGAGTSWRDVPLRGLASDVLALAQAKQMPADGSQGEDAARSGFPLPHALTTLASTAKETLKRSTFSLFYWPTPTCDKAAVEESDVPAEGEAFESFRVRSESEVPPITAKQEAQKCKGSRSRSGSMRRLSSSGSPRRRLSVDDRAASSSRCETVQGCLWDRQLSGDRAESFMMLPTRLRQLAKRLQSIEADAESHRQMAPERSIHGLCIPVHEEDVGSVIAHALMSRAVVEQMSSQWTAITGSPCCPLHRAARAAISSEAEAAAAGEEIKGGASPARAPVERWSTCARGDCSCLASLPQPLRDGQGQPSAALGSSSPSGSPDRDPQRALAQAKLAGLAWKHVTMLGDGEARCTSGEADEAPGSGRWMDEWATFGVRAALTTSVPVDPVRAEFTDQVANKYSVVIHHAPQYHILRHWLCGDDLNFARSLQHCKRLTTSGGKSGAAFFMSHDRRFLLKAINKAELKMLATQAEALFWYFDQVLFERLPSVLAQIVGMFTVSVTRRQKARVWKRTFIVQRNLRYSLQSQPHFCFDLKGIGKSRRAPAGAIGEGACASEGPSSSSQGRDFLQGSESGGEAAETPPQAVLWDQNFREWTQGMPLCLPMRDLRYLEAAVWNDTLLLKKQALVDYSLLLAAAPPHGTEASPHPLEPGTLALGIIDYVRPFTWDKQVESLMKSVTHAAASGQPTVIEPVDYASRFRNAMGTFFTAETPSFA